MLATEWSFGNVLWTMIVFFFWFMFIWMFIAIFADIFRRDDISGGAKAGWIILIVIVPFIGILIYVIARPKMTEQDRQMLQRSSNNSVEPRAIRPPTKWRSSRSCATRARSPGGVRGAESQGAALRGRSEIIRHG